MNKGKGECGGRTCSWYDHMDKDPEDHNYQRSDGYNINRCKNMMCDNFPRRVEDGYCVDCIKEVKARGLTMGEATCEYCETILTKDGRCVFPYDEYN